MQRPSPAGTRQGGSASSLDRLFSRFVHQGEAPLTTGSVGLGLFIAGMLAETMGGKLAYERVEGVPVFEFTLPLSRPPPLETDGVVEDAA